MRTLLSSQHQDGCVRRKERHRLMRHTGFPVSKSLDDFDFAELVITEGYGRKELLELGLQRVPRASCSIARLGTTSPISPQRSICAYINVRYEVPFFLSLSQQAPDGSFDGRSPRISAEGHKADGYRDSTRRRRRSPAVPGSLRKLQSALSHSHHQHQAQPMNRGREASCALPGPAAVHTPNLPALLGAEESAQMWRYPPTQQCAGFVAAAGDPIVRHCPHGGDAHSE